MASDRLAIVISLFTTCAWILSVASTAWCSFVNRNVNFDGTGDLSTMEQELLNFLLSSHGVGFWGWRLGDSCFDYTINGQEASFDTKFNTARASSIVAGVLGFVLTIISLMAVCIPVGNKMFMAMAMFLLMSCLFQGLALLILRSSICEPGFFGFTGNFPQNPEALPSVDCTLTSGSNCAVAATVLYFCAAIPCCLHSKQQNPEEEERSSAAAAAAAKEAEYVEEAQAAEENALAREDEQEKMDAEGQA